MALADNPLHSPLPTLQTYMEIGNRRGLIWTDASRAVLETLWSDRALLGAYAIRDRLRPTSATANANTVYRQLRKLMDAGLVLRAVLQRGYIISPDPTVTLWMIVTCSVCCTVVPVNVAHLSELFSKTFSDRRFLASDHYVEIFSRCSSCSTTQLAAL